MQEMLSRIRPSAELSEEMTADMTLYQDPRDQVYLFPSSVDEHPNVVIHDFAHLVYVCLCIQNSSNERIFQFIALLEV